MIVNSLTEFILIKIVYDRISKIPIYSPTRHNISICLKDLGIMNYIKDVKSLRQKFYKYYLNQRNVMILRVFKVFRL